MKIVIIGAGSLRTPLILQTLLASQNELGIDEITLMDIDEDRLLMVKPLTVQLEIENSPRITFVRTTDLVKALISANFVITVFRAGGMEARITDERVPLGYGVLGHEFIGAGGFSLGIRSLPIMMELVKLMELFCPSAWLINLCQPVAMLTEAIFRHTRWHKIVGISNSCAALSHIISFALKTVPDKLKLQYSGYSHLGWINEIQFQGKFWLQDVIRSTIESGEMPGLLYTPQDLEVLNLIPNENLYFYYHTQHAIENILTEGRTRAEQIQDANDNLFRLLRKAIEIGNDQIAQDAYDMYIFQRSQSHMAIEANNKKNAAQVFNSALIIKDQNSDSINTIGLLIKSLQQSQPQTLLLNVPNQGSIESMDNSTIVEVPCEIHNNEIHPLPVKNFPENCLKLMNNVHKSELLTTEAAIEHSYVKALQALITHPLVNDSRLASDILDTYIEKHSDFPQLR
ncbi:MAG: hypothetical protein JEZ06_18080 [Anaerolineaceae bacterium]|nr:hypothetical protein [Anaerolineaceae bacterium]